MRTQVAIVGEGPTGLLLSHLLDLEGVTSVLVECRSAEYVKGRIRAGILESGTVELLKEVGLGEPSSIGICRATPRESGPFRCGKRKLINICRSATRRQCNPPDILELGLRADGPVRFERKRELAAALPRELLELSWSCRRPLRAGEGFRPCGACKACLARAGI